MLSSLVSHGSDAESGTHRPSSNSHTPVSVSTGTYRSFSPSRRLFCLLAAFDFLATLFIWILYAHVSKLLSFLLKCVWYNKQGGLTAEYPATWVNLFLHMSRSLKMCAQVESWTIVAGYSAIAQQGFTMRYLYYLIIIINLFGKYYSLKYCSTFFA